MSRTKGSKNKPKDPTMPTKTASTAERVADVAQSKGEVAIFSPPRLPYHPKVEDAFGIDKGSWKVLVEAIFPAAKTVDAIAMALSYCKSRNLDVMKRPVHIVPMWDSSRGAYVETVWPGISELRTTASRTQGYAGCDEAQFGPNLTMTFNGRVKRKGDWVDEKMEIEFPEWCRITVYRIVGGQKCKFVGPKVKWLETYATQGASELPNKMWEERAEGQLEKCAEAAALRRAFPEEIGNELTAEEMTGRGVHDLAVEVAAIDQTAAASDRDTAPPRTASTAPEPEPGQDHAAGEVQDGAPPRRAPRAAEPKADPISSGPQRATAKTAAKTVEPFKISGENHTYESWSAKYVDHIKTSPDVATLYGWIDKNAEPLARLAKGKIEVSRDVKIATERVIESLRDVAKKREDKAAKTAAKAKPAEPPPSDMGDEPAGDMDDGTGEAPPDYGKPADDNPETVLKWIDGVLATAEDPADIEVLWETVCQRFTIDLMPPDRDEASALLRKHEKRLEP
jgi:phage recombination protein Bet